MSANKRSGFTLVELLTVVVIIGVLVGLLMPAIGAARERARQATCMNHLHEIGLAVQGYVAAKDRYPGFVSQRRTSWVIELLPFLGRNDLWKGNTTDDGWRTYDGTAANEGPKTFVEVFTCPNDTRNEMVCQLSYAANRYDATSNTLGVFTDHTVTSPVVRTPEDIADIGGVSQVVMIGELSARRNSAGNVVADDQARVWFDSSWTDATRQTHLTFAWNNASTLGTFLGSGHPGIVQLIFCDGHGEAFATGKPTTDPEFAQ